MCYVGEEHELSLLDFLDFLFLHLLVADFLLGFHTEAYETISHVHEKCDKQNVSNVGVNSLIPRS